MAILCEDKEREPILASQMRIFLMQDSCKSLGAVGPGHGMLVEETKPKTEIIFDRSLALELLFLLNHFEGIATCLLLDFIDRKRLFLLFVQL